MVDGAAKGEARSETGKKELFHQRDDGFACLRTYVTPRGDLFGASGVIPCPLKAAKTFKMAGAEHDSGRRRQ